MPRSPVSVRFGIFEFDPVTGELTKSGRLVPLEPQPARALATLVARAGDVVSKDELRDAIWGRETHVDFDRGLAYCLSQIRFALGDSADSPRFVQTLPKRGYRFLVPVQSARSSSEPERIAPQPPAATPARERWIAAGVAILVIAGLSWWAFVRPSPSPPRVVIAVSIFDNESGMAEHDRLVAGLSDVVVTQLAAIAPERIGIVGNAAILRQPRNIRDLRAVAEGVKADYVILGQLQRADPGLRFITHFIRLSDQTHLKANRIPLPDGNVTGLESAVVAEFERAVREHVLTPVARGRTP